MDKLKSLPSNIEAEQELLSCIMVNNKRFDEIIDQVSTEDFYKDSHKLIFENMKKLYMRDISIDPVTLINEIGKENIERVGGVTYLSELLTGGLREISIKKYAEIIREKANRRRLIKAGQELIEKAYQENEEVAEIVNGAQDKLLETTKVQDNMIFTDEELMMITLDEVQKRYQNGGEIPGMRTGLKSLDNAINGVRKKELTVVAARPSMGKTAFSLRLADGLGEHGYKVAVFEMEMSAESLGVRRLAANAFIEATKLNRGTVKDSDFEMIAKKSNELAGRNNVFTDCSANLSLEDIKARSKRIKQKFGLDVIIIDHLTLMKIGKRERRDLEIADVTMGLKALAKELDIAVILLSQLNRGVEARADRRPMLSDLRESGAIEQDADLVIFLYRDEYYNPESDQKCIMEAIIAKQRDGKTGTLKFAFLKEFQVVGELDVVRG